MAHKWDPFNDMRHLQNAMDRMWRGAGTPARVTSENPVKDSWAVPLDVSRTGDETLIRASLPGVSPDDIDVSIEDNVLTIKGQTSDEQRDEGETYLMRERRTGSFHRALRLPDSLDPNKVEPRYEHGVLTITVPKAEAKRARQLTVQVGGNNTLEGGGN